MTTRKRTAEETLRALEKSAADDEMERILGLSPEQVDEELRDAGFDPQAVGERGARLAEGLLGKREEQAWQGEAHEKLAQVRASFEARRGARGSTRLSNAELRKRIEVARADPRLAGQVAVFFRNKTEDEATDEELEELLEEIEALGAKKE